jgi:putative membrane protein
MPSDFGPGFHEGIERGFDGGPHWLGLVPLVMIAVVIGVIVWAVIRLTRGGHVAFVGGSGPTQPRTDAALEELRLRYARGEMTREDYGDRLHDLTGGPGARPSEPPPESA